MFTYCFMDKGFGFNYVWVESSVPIEEDEDFCYNCAEASFDDDYGYIPDDFIITKHLTDD